MHRNNVHGTEPLLDKRAFGSQKHPATGFVSPAAQLGMVCSPPTERKLGLKTSMTWYDGTLRPTAVCEVGKSLITSLFFFYPFFLHSVLITSWMLFQFSILEYYISNEDLCKMQNTVILTESCGILSGWLQINMHFWLHKHTASKKPFLCPHLWRGTNSCTPTASKSQLMGGEQTNQPTNPPTLRKDTFAITQKGQLSVSRSQYGWNKCKINDNGAWPCTKLLEDSSF